MSISELGTTQLIVSGPGTGNPPVQVLSNTSSTAIGNTTVGADKIAVITDTKRTIRTVFAGESISGLRLWCDGLGGGTGTATLKAVVYANNSNNWGARYAYGTEVSIAAGRPGGFVDLPFSSPITPTGTYHIGIHVGGNSPIVRVALIATGIPMLVADDTYSDGASDPGGTGIPDQAGRSFTLYALVNGPGGGPGGGTLTFTENLAPGTYYYDVYTEDQSTDPDETTRVSANRYPLVIEIPQVGGGGVNSYAIRVQKATEPDLDVIQLWKVTSGSPSELYYAERDIANNHKFGIRLFQGKLNYYWYDGTWQRMNTPADITATDYTNGVISISLNSSAARIDDLQHRAVTLSSDAFASGAIIWSDNFNRPDGTLKDNVVWLDSMYDGDISARIISNQVGNNDDGFFQDGYTIAKYGDGDYLFTLAVLPAATRSVWMHIVGLPQTLQIAGRYSIDNTFDTETVGAVPNSWTNLSGSNVTETTFDIVQSTPSDRALRLKTQAATAGVTGYISSAYNTGLDYSKDTPRAVKIVFSGTGPGSSRIYLHKQVRTGDISNFARFLRLRYEGTSLYIERMQTLPGTPDLLDTVTGLTQGDTHTVWIEIDSINWRIKVNGVNYDTFGGDGVMHSHALQYTKGNFHVEVSTNSVTPTDFRIHELKAMATVPSAPINLTAVLQGNEVEYDADQALEEDMVTKFGFQLVKSGLDFGAPIESATVPVRAAKPTPGTYTVEAYVENESPW